MKHLAFIVQISIPHDMPSYVERWRGIIGAPSGGGLVGRWVFMTTFNHTARVRVHCGIYMNCSGFHHLAFHDFMFIISKTEPGNARLIH